MGKKHKVLQKGGKRGTVLLSAQSAVEEFVEKSSDQTEENDDPRFQGLNKLTMSRKARRKNERQEKKQRIRAFHSGKRKTMLLDKSEESVQKTSETVEEIDTSTKSSQREEKNSIAEKKRGKKRKLKETKLLDKSEESVQKTSETVEEIDTSTKSSQREEKNSIAEKKRAKKRKLKETKMIDSRRKQALLEANEIEERNIKRLQKLLRFRKKKKTKEVIIPGQFKYDGLDYLLDVVDPIKLAKLREENETILDEPQHQLERHLGGHSDDDGGSDDDVDGDEADEEAIDVGNDEENTARGRNNEEDVVRDSGDDEDIDSGSDDEGDIDGGMGDERDIDESKDKEDVIKGTYSDGHIEEEEGFSEDMEEATEDGDKIQGRNSQKKEEMVNYIPPQKRALMIGESMDNKRKAELERLRRQLKGLINRLSSSNVMSICKDIETLYQTNSRNDMNGTLCSLVEDALIIRSLSADRLVMELVLLVSVLHFNIGIEVGAHFLQTMTVKFDELHKRLDKDNLDNKECNNALLILVHLYNFKIVHCCLIYDIILRLVESFTEQDIEMLLALLKSAGMSLRKDDPLALKEIIILIQGKAAAAPEEFKQQSRIKYMLETISALRNNDSRKMLTSNTEHLDTLRKTLRNLTKNRDHSSELSLRIPLEDLLSTEQKGRWWIVGSAWKGHGPNRSTEKLASGTESSIPAVIMDHSTSEKIMELSRQQRMNTDLRRSIFGLVMTAEDHEDCFNKLLPFASKNKAEKECVLVVIDCCQQERLFNPYYAHILSKLCLFDRKFRIACQFAYWDRFQILGEMSKTQINNLASLLSYLLLVKAGSLSIFKVIEFSDLNKNTALFLRKVLLKVLQQKPNSIRLVFGSITGVEKLSHLRDTLSLFLHHFILKQAGKRSSEEQQILKEHISMADSTMKGEREVQIGP